MSDRRERVAKAISDALPGYMHARGVLDPTGKVPHWWPNGEGTLALADAAIAAYESSVVFECDECGGRGKIVGQYDQDDALSVIDADPTGDELTAMDAEPTEAEIEAAMEAFAFEYPLRGLREDMGWHPSFEAAMYAGLTAFLAARKARP